MLCYQQPHVMECAIAKAPLVFLDPITVLFQKRDFVCPRCELPVEFFVYLRGVVVISNPRAEAIANQRGYGVTNSG